MSLYSVKQPNPPTKNAYSPLNPRSLICDMKHDILYVVRDIVQIVTVVNFDLPKFLHDALRMN